MPPPTPRSRPPARREEPRRQRRNPWRWLLAALIVLLAGIAIALALSLPGSNRENISNGNVDDQVGDLIQYVRDHTE